MPKVSAICPAWASWVVSLEMVCGVWSDLLVDGQLLAGCTSVAEIFLSFPSGERRSSALMESLILAQDERWRRA